MPAPSASTWTSTWRARSTASSRNTVGSPKAVAASRVGRLDRGPQVLGPLHPPEPAAATAGRRLYEQGEADPTPAATSSSTSVPRAGAAQHGDARRRRLLLGPHLVAGQGQDPGRRADEGDPGLLARPGQLGVLRQEAVARGRWRPPRSALRDLDQARGCPGRPGGGGPVRLSRSSRRPSGGGASSGPRTGRPRPRCSRAR